MLVRILSSIRVSSLNKVLGFIVYLRVLAGKDQSYSLGSRLRCALYDHCCLYNFNFTLTDVEVHSKWEKDKLWHPSYRSFAVPRDLHSNRNYAAMVDGM